MTAAVLTAVLLGALAQSVSGIGFSLVSGPLLVALLGHGDGVRLGLVLSLALNSALVVAGRRHLQWRRAALLLVPVVLTLPAWAALVQRLPSRLAQAVAGAAVVLGAAVLATGRTSPRLGGTAGAVLAGVVAAGTTTVASVGGPPLALWSAAAGWQGPAQRATLQVVFLGTNVVALAVLGTPRVAPSLLWLAVAGVAVGACAGSRLATRVPARAARAATLALAAAGGLTVLIRALA